MVKKNGKEKDHEEKDHKEDDKEEDDQKEVLKEKEKVNPQFLLIVRGIEHKTAGLVFRRETPSQSGLFILMGTLT